MASLLDAIYDKDTGLVLGRDSSSWAKILGFYAVYYTFLGFLFYGFTISYYQGSNTTPVGGAPVVKNSRLDQPGAAVHPFLERMEDGAVNKLVIGSKKDQLYPDAYCDSLAEFYDAKVTLNEKAEDCSGAANPESSTCLVNTNLALPADDQLNGKPFNAATCRKLMDEGKPMFAIDVNKIVGWTPSHEGIGFNCYSIDESTGEADGKNFTFVWTSGNNRIPAYYYPFKGVSSKQLVKLPIDARTAQKDSEECNTDLCSENKPYNKPFVGGYIETEDDKIDAMFRCDVVNSKINKPGKNLSPEANTDLRKLGIGFVEFGFKLKKKN